MGLEGVGESGGAIYTDGDPLQVKLSRGESITVPEGTSFVIESMYYAGGSNYNARAYFNSIKIGDGEEETFITELSLAHGGDKFSINDFDATLQINGWRL